MHLHRVLAHSKLVGDLLVGQSLAEGIDDHGLTLREPFAPRRGFAADVIVEAAHRYESAASQHQSHRFDDNMEWQTGREKAARTILDDALDKLLRIVVGHGDDRNLSRGCLDRKQIISRNRISAVEINQNDFRGLGVLVLRTDPIGNAGKIQKLIAGVSDLETSSEAIAENIALVDDDDRAIVRVCFHARGSALQLIIRHRWAIGYIRSIVSPKWRSLMDTCWS